MRQFPQKTRIFIFSVVFASLLMLLYLFWGLISAVTHKQALPFNYMILLGFCIFTPVVIIAELRPEEFLGRIATIVSFSVIYAAILFIGKEAAVIIAIIRNITAGLVNKMKWYSILFNVSQSVLTLGAAGLLLNAVVLEAPLFGIKETRLSYIISGALIVALSTGLVYLYIRSLENLSAEPLTFYLQWRDIKIQTIIFSVFLFVVLYKQSPLILVLMLLPSVVIYYIIRNYRKLQTETMKTLEALATGIEHRYGYSYQHTSGVVDYAVKLAKKMKLHRAEVEIIESAARIHDLGKVSIPDGILQKPGPLTMEEFEIMKQHAVMGSEIASKLSAYKSGVSYIRHHHEWYDGSGYPDGLRGEDIPVGARILTIADCFDAMTNERPYRSALPLSEVARELVKGKGTHFDPKLVDLFIELLKDEQKAKTAVKKKPAAPSEVTAPEKPLPPGSVPERPAPGNSAPESPAPESPASGSPA